MKQKYLLYIDILGFANLSSHNDQSIRNIYEAINELNVHRHDAFDTIVFSDTILVSNKHDLIDHHSHEYHVMYCCEFVQDLLFRCEERQLKVPFRAILFYGEFEFYKLSNISCYYGQALIECYQKEKEVNGVGFFMHKNILKFNKFYETIYYDKDLNYVFLTQTLNSYYKTYQGETPIPRILIEAGYDFYRLPTEIDIIKKYYYESLNNPDPKVRSKYLQTYQFYKSKYQIIINKLESHDFSYSVINDEVDWETQRHQST